MNGALVVSEVEEGSAAALSDPMHKRRSYSHGWVLAAEDHDVNRLAFVDDLGDVTVADRLGVDPVAVGRAHWQGLAFALNICVGEVSEV